MQEIKTTLDELDAMRDVHNDDFPMYLAGSYPAIRAYIEKLEREAEAGRVLVETMQSWHKDEYLHSECIDGCCGLEEHWEDWREAALSAYHSATRDITSKEKEV